MAEKTLCSNIWAFVRIWADRRLSVLTRPSAAARPDVGTVSTDRVALYETNACCHALLMPGERVEKSRPPLLEPGCLLRLTPY